MTDSANTWATRFHLLLLHPREARILLQLAEAGWTLPTVDSDVHVWWRNMEDVNEQIQLAAGSQVTGLHCISRLDVNEERRSERIYTCECRSERLELSGTWCGRADLGGAIFANTRHEGMVLRALEELEGCADPDRRPPWCKPGWYDRAAAWFGDRLKGHGLAITERIQCIYSWPVSAVLHARTSAGEIYMKAASHLADFVNEPVLTSFLPTVLPGRVPEPIQIEYEQRWMMLPDLGYPIRYAPEKQKAEALLSFGELQRAAAEHVQTFLAMGCPDRRAHSLERCIESLTNSPVPAIGLTRDEIDRLPEAGRRLRGVARRLADYNIPDTLGHGDLHPGNIARVDGRFVFFDWGQACVTHPFIEALFYIREAEVGHLPDAYVRQWLDYEPEGRLREAHELAGHLVGITEAMNQYCLVVNLKPEPEELPQTVANRFREMLQVAEGLPEDR